ATALTVTSNANARRSLRTRTSPRCNQPGLDHLRIDCGLNWPVKFGIGTHEAHGVIPFISVDIGPRTIRSQSRLTFPTATVCRDGETQSIKRMTMVIHESLTATNNHFGKAIRISIPTSPASLVTLTRSGW